MFRGYNTSDKTGEEKGKAVQDNGIEARQNIEEKRQAGQAKELGIRAGRTFKRENRLTRIRSRGQTEQKGEETGWAG
jgi:hypothetical protein